MKITFKSEMPVLIVSLEGELTLNNLEEVKERFEVFLQEAKDMVIEAARLSYVDSSGLGLLLEISQRLKQKGLRSLVLANLMAPLRKTMEVTHLVQIMPLYNSLEEAVQGFSSSWSWQIPSSLSYVKSISNRILESLSGLGLEESRVYELRLCIEEAVINAMKHGSKLKYQQLVTVGYKLENRHLEISISDEGEGFDKNQRGKGLTLIFNFMDEVRFNQRGNRIEMLKNL